MEKLIPDYRIPPNVGLRYCKEGEWHLKRRTGEVVIPLLAFIKGDVRIPMGPVMRSYKVTPHYWPHGDSHIPFYKGEKGNHHLARSSLKVPLPLLAVPQTHIGRYPIVGD